MRSAFFLGGLGLWVWGCSSPPTTELTNDHHTYVIGRVEAADGSPAEDVRVELSGQGVVRTAFDGSFSFDPAKAGAAALGAHDGAGQAALISLVVRPAGVTDVGTLRLGPANAVPGVMLLEGLGFERRLTTLDGTCARWTFDSSAAHVYCEVNGDARFQRLVEISLPDGAIRTITETPPGLCGAHGPTLIGDRVLRYGARLFDLGRPEAPVVYHLRETPIGVPLEAPDCDQAVFGLDGERLWVVHLTTDGDPELATVDLANPSAEPVRRASGRTWPRWFDLTFMERAGAKGAQVVLRTLYRNQEPPFGVWLLNLEDGSWSPLSAPAASEESQIRSSLEGEPPVFVTGVLAGNLETIDLGTGARRDLTPPGRSFWASLAGGRMFLSSVIPDVPVTLPIQLSWVDPTTGATVNQAAQAEIDGHVERWTLHECVDIAADGRITMTSTTSDPDKILVLSYDATGASQEAQLSKEPLDRGQCPSFLRTPDGAQEAMLAPDPKNPRLRIKLGPSQTELSTRPARTFLTAPTALQFSADGAWLFYVATDPLSGNAQVFGVPASEP